MKKGTSLGGSETSRRYQREPSTAASRVGATGMSIGGGGGAGGSLHPLAHADADAMRNVVRRRSMSGV
jgi:hypothetical protein